MVGWLVGSGIKAKRGFVSAKKKVYCGPVLTDVIKERVSGSLTMVYDTMTSRSSLHMHKQ